MSNCRTQDPDHLFLTCYSHYCQITVCYCARFLAFKRESGDVADSLKFSLSVVDEGGFLFVFSFHFFPVILDGFNELLQIINVSVRQRCLDLKCLDLITFMRNFNKFIKYSYFVNSEKIRDRILPDSAWISGNAWRHSSLPIVYDRQKISPDTSILAYCCNFQFFTASHSLIHPFILRISSAMKFIDILPSQVLLQFQCYFTWVGLFCPKLPKTFAWPLMIISHMIVHVPNFGGCQGRRTGVGVTTVSNSLMLGGGGGVSDKRFEEYQQKIGEWKCGWQQYFDFFMPLAQQKMPL